MGVHRYWQQERGNLHQRVQSGSASRRAHGLRARLLCTDQDSSIPNRLRQGLRQEPHWRHLSPSMGEVRTLPSQVRQRHSNHPCILYGELSRRGRHHHTQRPHRYTSIQAKGSRSRLHGCEPRYRVILHLLSETRRQGDYVRSLRRVPSTVRHRP